MHVPVFGMIHIGCTNGRRANKTIRTEYLSPKNGVDIVDIACKKWRSGNEANTTVLLLLLYSTSRGTMNNHTHLIDFFSLPYSASRGTMNNHTHLIY